MRRVLAAIGIVLAASAGSNGPVVARDDVVRHVVHCPGTVEYGIDWQDKFGEVPFSIRPGMEQDRHKASLRLMTRFGQRITCVYGVGSVVAGSYDHQIRGSIVACRTVRFEPGKGGVMECELRR